MYIHDGQWLIEAAEIYQKVEELKIGKGALSVLPPAPDKASIIQPKEGQEETKLLDKCIRILANPDKVLYLHYNIADGVVSRSALAKSEILPETWVTISGTSDPYSISIRSEAEIKFLVGDVLSTNNLWGSQEFGSDMSTQGALTLMAVLDHVRRSWMISALNHVEPIGMFSLEDIRERLVDSQNEDFRWTLHFTEKHIPIPVKEMDFLDDLRPAMQELIDAGLVEEIDEEGDLFDITKEGEYLAEIERQAASRMVLSRVNQISEGEITYDIFTFIRGPLDLILYLLSGGNASFGALQPYDAEVIISEILDPSIKEDLQEIGVEGTPEREAEAKPEPEMAPEGARASFCSQCGNPVGPEALFCQNCGSKLG